MPSFLRPLILLSLCLAILSQPQVCFDYCAPNGCNCYKLFNVARNAPLSEIKEIYRALSRQLHPDRNPGKGTDARFAEIASCYDILKDTRSRAQYNDCMNYDQSNYVPKSKHDSLWGLAIPIISLLVNTFRRQGGQAGQPGQPGQGGSTWKKILKGLGYVAIAVMVFLVLLTQAPFVLEPFIGAFHYVFYDIFGGDVFWFVLAGVWGFALVKKVVEKIRSFLNKSSIEDEIKAFFIILRKAIDTKQEKVVQETNEKRKAKEDELNKGKVQELEILKRYHDESVGFVGGKPEANEEEKALLKSEKEQEFEKIYNRNVQLCESRHSEKLKEMEEEFNGLVEKNAKAFGSYRDFVAKFEGDIETKRKEKKISKEKLREELQVMMKDLTEKMSKCEPVEKCEQVEKNEDESKENKGNMNTNEN